MRLLNTNLIQKTNRMDRPTMILLILSETDRRVIILEMADKVYEKVEDILARDNIHLQKYDLYDQIVMNSYDYIIQADYRKEDFVLFTYKDNEQFCISDYLSLGHFQQLTRSVIDLMILEVYSKNSNLKISVGSSVIMSEAIDLAGKSIDLQNASVFERLDKLLINFKFLINNRALLPFYHDSNWMLLDIKLIWLGQGSCE